MPKPLCIDLFCGLGGWTEGFLSEGWDVVGFDIKRHQYGQHRYPAQLVLQNVLSLQGSQFRGRASVIVASPPCQKYSYMAMPWSRAKELAKWYRAEAERQVELNALFNSCFRIAKEAGLPLIVETVKGAQPWIGTAAWHYGSFYLWGDVPALMPLTLKTRKSTHVPLCETPVGVGSTSWFHGNSKHEARFYGEKTNGHANIRDGFSHTRHLTNQRESDAVKVSGDWFGSYAEQKAAGTISPGRLHGKNSTARKAASAMIAKIPFELSSHIARVFKP